MMRALLDVNTLVALLDVEHIHHARAAACADPLHAFWPDDLCLTDPGTLNWQHIPGHRQLTDAYLLALAVRHGGRFVTFDRRLIPEAVPGAGPWHLVVLDWGSLGRILSRQALTCLVGHGHREYVAQALGASRHEPPASRGRPAATFTLRHQPARHQQVKSGNALVSTTCRRPRPAQRPAGAGLRAAAAPVARQLRAR